MAAPQSMLILQPVSCPVVSLYILYLAKAITHKLYHLYHTEREILYPTYRIQYFHCMNGYCGPICVYGQCVMDKSCEDRLAVYGRISGVGCEVISMEMAYRCHIQYTGTHTDEMAL